MAPFNGMVYNESAHQHVDQSCRQVDINQRLLASGFSIEDIKRYYEEQRSRRRRQENESQVSSGSTASLQSQVAMKGSEDCGEPSAKLMTRQSHDAKERIFGEPVVDPGSCAGAIRKVSESRSLRSSSPESSINLPYRHAAVRRSSLLRFSQMAASTSSSPVATQADVTLDNKPPSPARPRKSYRARSHTYPYIESEADDGGPTGPVDSHVHSSPPEAISFPMPLSMSSSDLSLTSTDLQLRQGSSLRPAQSSALRPEAEPFVPTTAPSPVQYRLPDRTRRATPYPFNIPARSSSSLVASSSRSDGPPAVPTTPPQAQASTQAQDPGSSSSVSLPPPLPASPTPSLRRSRPPRTDPRTLHRQSRHGNSLRVYNDSHPAMEQPQTPADLSRRPLLTEYEAAYTAPPGMMGSANHSVQRRRGEGGNDRTVELGEQSPTVRSARMREWRGRELRRSVRVEAMRMRQNHVGGVNEGQRWRQDLDEDRVGEENFAEEGGL